LLVVATYDVKRYQFSTVSGYNISTKSEDHIGISSSVTVHFTSDWKKCDLWWFTLKWHQY